MREFPFWSTQSGFEKLVCSIMMKSIQTLWYVIPAIASEYPSEYIHHTREAGSRLTETAVRSTVHDQFENLKTDKNRS
jgi:hypothetical protein